MIELLVIMFLGMVLGYFLRNRSKFIHISNKLGIIIIYLLLFVLGISVGLNETIISKIDTIGLKALIITIGALMGSLIFAYITYKLFFVPKHEK